MAEGLLDVLRSALPEGFAVESFLSKGGQGAVFAGTCGGRKAALKCFDPTEDPRRLIRELEALREIDCPNIAKLLGHTEVTVNSQVVRIAAYELYPGGDLRSFVRQAVTVDTLLTIAVDMSNAIETLWSKRIVHRDIKPANIVCRDDGHFVLVDLGYALHLGHSDLTSVGWVVGTAGYRSPEQALGWRNLTISSDTFSLGVTLYELATGQHPFGHAQQLIGSTLPRPIGELRDDLPPRVERLIHEMMATKAYARPAGLHSRFVELTGGNSVLS